VVGPGRTLNLAPKVIALCSKPVELTGPACGRFQVRCGAARQEIETRRCGLGALARPAQPAITRFAKGTGSGMCMTNFQETSITYADAGVDIDCRQCAARAVSSQRPSATSPGGDCRAFGRFRRAFDLKGAGYTDADPRLREPMVLAPTADRDDTGKLSMALAVDHWSLC